MWFNAGVNDYTYAVGIKLYGRTDGRTAEGMDETDGRLDYIMPTATGWQRHKMQEYSLYTQTDGLV